jgi:glutamate-1-semialdehyde aminotransferase
MDQQEILSRIESKLNRLDKGIEENHSTYEMKAIINEVKTMMQVLFPRPENSIPSTPEPQLVAMPEARDLQMLEEEAKAILRGQHVAITPERVQDLIRHFLAEAEASLQTKLN